MSGSLSDVRVPLTVPAVLAVRLRQLADRDCSTLAAVARRLIAHGLARELPSERISDSDAGQKESQHGTQ